MRAEADVVVSAIVTKWSAAFGKLDAGALASLYSKSAFFFGSNPTLYRGRDGVAAYFNSLPRWRSPSVRFSEVAAAQVGPDVINMAAIASFDLGEEAAPLSVKLTWVIVREDGDWKIASHHVSSRAALI
ncbi:MULTISPECIES: SgcJ/EcaC family oxidoreductase [unclassified Bradyrhizobium]|uniref:YybH family protein n=1 Tax=unclassified Bradyrhizobium TaxID=2631580 RepID=UPI0024793248|nr:MULTISPECIES: SgcJ/EcaC family oxidoreductase [unclassified Bradyrhizobium]WGR74872.1 nuclear transport factor 2 family protein [Bradyrhizobium sp. ISRA426]WGR79708.1 nuclear transport factor 2 family protein [Bradyrhizobium sp. ISRA430]WGR90044.1 nuclear transport factor 2 family protein [Bradyrhizobium sp. ISRA432]